MIERIADFDEQVMISYIEGHELSVDELVKAVRRGTIGNSFTPVLCGSALKNVGVQRLLDAIVDYLPAPDEVPPVEGITHDGPESRRADPSEPLTALAFKIVTDPYVGRIAYVRIYARDAGRRERPCTTRLVTRLSASDGCCVYMLTTARTLTT